MSETFEVRNPATGLVIGRLPLCGPGDLDATLVEVATVQALWAQLRLADRARYLRRTAQAVIDEFGELAELIAQESGRPLVEVQSQELLSAIDAIRWLAGEGEQLLASTRIPLSRALHPFKRASLGFEPAGIVAVIGSGSAPLAAPLCQIAAALLGGNGVVYKPAPRASLSAERIGALLTRAGLPEGVVRVCHGGGELGRTLVESPRVARVLFTGGPRAAAEVAQSAALGGRGAVIECGGADPMLVLGDAHLGRAVAGALWAACAGAGQLHGAVKRIYVAQELHERFVADLTRAAGAINVGDPLDPSTQLGPLASHARLERLTAALEEARSDGAKVLCGEALQPAGLAGAFHSPAVLSGVLPDMRVARERIAGPLLAVVAVRDSTEAVALANAGEHGLGASVWTADRYHGARVARELEAATVWLNDHLPNPGVGRAPWGSVAGAGVWRSQGAAGLRNCVETKLITWDPPSARAPWHHPYDPVMGRAAHAVAQLWSNRNGDRERARRQGTLALLRQGARVLRDTRRP
jgi:acyl-CoA reductase-like NAD-dependent aldehyde dehydrogenase